ncbi:uncharacterized protein LOC120313277 [Crotalus tigris]|uniref:uncharacterized protein LOC120313277 n=1 Tax=Crotalus tigris TaxID=88082 RepID=UPI00192F2A73|nr:uncharacterized protein LOC120313277 [Crotalus tigris]
MVAITEMFFVVFNLLSLSLGYFGPKGRVIYVLPERNTVAFFQAAIQGYSMDQAGPFREPAEGRHGSRGFSRLWGEKGGPNWAQGPLPKAVWPQALPELGFSQGTSWPASLQKRTEAGNVLDNYNTTFIETLLQGVKSTVLPCTSSQPDRLAYQMHPEEMELAGKDQELGVLFKSTRNTDSAVKEARGGFQTVGTSHSPKAEASGHEPGSALF